MQRITQLDPTSDPDVIRILAISDTHNKHTDIWELPNADILVHGGDFTMVGAQKWIESYDEWIGEIVGKQHKFKYAVLIAGCYPLADHESLI